MSTQLLVVFDGFRGRRDPDSGSIRSLLASLELDVVAHHNVYDGAGDTLSDRLDRTKEWIHRKRGNDIELHLFGYSMGCQLAVRFADQAISTRLIGSMVLVAPDPKYRRCTQDDVETRRGDSSAFDEAKDLWGVTRGPGPEFVAALQRVASASRLACRILYCKDDEVAEWVGNGELMVRVLARSPAVGRTEARRGLTIRDHGMSVSVGKTDDIHEALGTAVRFH